MRTLRLLAAIAIATVTWFAVLKGALLLLEELWPAYSAAHSERAYTLSMLLVRLVIFALTTAATAVVATVISREAWMPWLAGAILLAASIPDHLFPGYVWDDFPVWYHLAYLAYVLPVAWFAGRVVQGQRI